MVDDSNCSSGVHELCCPPDDGTPTCGWYQHNNGGCEVSCPSGAIEIGSHSGNCNNNKYQAACCTTGSKSMELHDQCSWTEAPMCMNGFCSSGQNEVALSPTGSGGAVCNMETFSWGGGGKVQERKLCCNEKDDKKWDDCQWYDNLGFGKDQEGWCRSGCPNDRVRVSMDKYWNKDSAFGCRGGARSRCCIPKYATIIKRESSQDEILRDALTAFLKEPVCASDGPGWTFSSVSRRDLSMSASEMGMPKEEKDKPMFICISMVTATVMDTIEEIRAIKPFMDCKSARRALATSHRTRSKALSMPFAQNSHFQPEGYLEHSGWEEVS
ncbi:hypothetical protein SNK04_013860 [Fusarium graminearum]